MLKGNPEWDGYVITGNDTLYDVNLNEIGVLISLNNEKDDAYAVVLENENRYYVIEAGKGESSPYQGYEESTKIYLAPLNYYGMENGEVFDVNLSERVSLQDLRKSHLAKIDLFDFNAMRDSDPTINPTPDDIVGFISDYYSSFIPTPTTRRLFLCSDFFCHGN